MNLQQTLPPDDLPPDELTPADKLLYEDLLSAISKRFYEACSGVVQAVLLACDWQLELRSAALILEIHCEDTEFRQRVINYLGSMARSLSQVSPRIRICVYHAGQTQPYEIQYDDCDFNGVDSI